MSLNAVDTSVERLSRSKIWQLQREFYAEQKLEAFRRGGVPSFISSNIRIAVCYAKLIHAFAVDQYVGDNDMVLTVLDLGCGSGKFGFHCIQELVNLFNDGDEVSKHVSVRYIFTDFQEESLEELKQAEQLSNIDGIRVGFAQLDNEAFDAESCQILTATGDVISTIATLPGPLVLVGNYFFDTLPQDVFHIDEHGVIYEDCYQAHSIRRETDLTDPGILDRLSNAQELCWHRRKIRDLTNYYGSPESKDLAPLHEACIVALQRQSEAVVNDDECKHKGGSLLVPVGALEIVYRISAAINHHNVLLLVGDKGRAQWPRASTPCSQPPTMAQHGSISWPVSFHFLECLYTSMGAFSLSSKRASEEFHISAYVFPKITPAMSLTNLRRVVHNNVVRNNPVDFFEMQRSTYLLRQQMSTTSLLSVVRLSHHDPDVTLKFKSELLQRVSTMGHDSRLDLSQMLLHVWKNVYHIKNNAVDMAYEIGELCVALHQHKLAVACLMHSIAHQGEHYLTNYLLGQCFIALQKPEQARIHLESAVQECPEFVAAVHLLDQLV